MSTRRKTSNNHQQEREQAAWVAIGVYFCLGLFALGCAVAAASILIK